MADKKSFLLRIDAEKFDALEKWAADEFRSVNGQIEWLMHKALSDAKRLPKPLSKPEKTTREDEK